MAGDIYFNPYGASRRPIAIGQVKEGRFLPSRFQLIYVKYPELAKARQHKAPIFKVDGRYTKRTTVVFTGIHVNDVRSFDPIKSQFEADFLLWFRWDPDQNKKLNFEMTHGEVLSAKIREKYYHKESKNNFIAYSVTARMEGVFPLHDYPFDHQILKIRIKPKVKSKEDLILVTDIPDDSFLRRDLTFGQWEDERHVQFTSSKDFIWSYRNPKYGQKIFELDHSQFNYHLHLKRNVAQYVIKLLPLFVVLFGAYLIFFIDYEYVPSRYALGIITLLSAISAHNATKLEVGYLVRSDIFFLITYFLIVFSILETVIASTFFMKGQKKIAKRLDEATIVMFPILIVVALYHLID